jgi:L-lactate utilization protein LutC
MSARDNILQRLRAAPQGTPPLAPDVRAFHARAAPARQSSTRAARIELFCEKMAFWHGEVVRVTRENWPQKLRELCAAKGVRSLLYGESSTHAALTGAGIAG